MIFFSLSVYTHVISLHLTDLFCIYLSLSATLRIKTASLIFAVGSSMYGIVYTNIEVRKETL